MDIWNPRRTEHVSRAGGQYRGKKRMPRQVKEGRSGMFMVQQHLKPDYAKHQIVFQFKQLSLNPHAIAVYGIWLPCYLIPDA